MALYHAMPWNASKYARDFIHMKHILNTTIELNIAPNLYEGLKCPVIVQTHMRTL